MAGTFDPQAFLDVTFDTGFDTKLIPVPEGPYPGVCGEASIRTPQGYTFLEVPIEIDSSARTPKGDTVAEATGRDKNIVRFSAGLEFNGAGGLDKSPGKNVGLGRILEAIGANKGEKFSVRMFQGRALKVMVKHRISGEDIYAEVKGVSPL